MAQRKEIESALEVLKNFPEEQLEDILASVRDGAKNLGESLGLGASSLNSIERIAQAYYGTHQFSKAAMIYSFVLHMHHERASAWRGLGACAQATRQFGKAGRCYKLALALQPKDVPSSVFLAECMCQLGMRDEGVAVLKKVLDEGTEIPRFKPFLTRARAIVAEGGGVPNTLLLRRHGEAVVKRASEEMQRQEAVATGYRPSEVTRPIELDKIRRNPKLYAGIKELTKMVDEGRLTYAQVGGFTDLELDGAYAVACRYAAMNQVGKAMQVAGYLIFIDPHKGRYYQLVGICMQRLKQYEAAEMYYGMADIFDPDDPLTCVYRGESLIMAGKTDSGLEHVRRARDLAAHSTEESAKSAADRAEALLQRFGG